MRKFLSKLMVTQETNSESPIVTQEDKISQEEAEILAQLEAEEAAKKSSSVQITSEEIQLISSEDVRIVGAPVVFEKDVPVFVTDAVLASLRESSNFVSLMDKGVIKVGL